MVRSGLPHNNRQWGGGREILLRLVLVVVEVISVMKGSGLPHNKRQWGGGKEILLRLVMVVVEMISVMILNI